MFTSLWNADLKNWIAHVQLVVPYVLIVQTLGLGAPNTDPPCFEEVSKSRELIFAVNHFPTPEKYLIETMGGGCAFLDFDQDGVLDAYFVNGAAIDSGAKVFDKSDPRYWNRLFRGVDGTRFEDVTEKAGVQGRGYGNGVAVGDYDNDGHPDLYVTNYGFNELFHNNGDGTFTEVAAQTGVRGGDWSTSAIFFDYNRDGYLDIYVARYLDWSFERNLFCGQPEYRSYCHPDHFSGVPDLLFRNNGDGTFRDASQEAGVDLVEGKGLGVVANDFDLDGFPDLFVANDAVPCFLLHNLEGKRFEEIAFLSGVALNQDGRTFAGMGADFNDFNNDGLPDIFVTALSLQGYSLFRNEGSDSFADVSASAGITIASSKYGGWGTQFVDYNNDGWKDLFVANSHVMDNIEVTLRTISYKQPPLLLQNRNAVFHPVQNAGTTFSVSWPARGAAFGDYDNDGDIDILVSNLGENALLLENAVGKRNNWVGLELVGTQSNRDGIGARVQVEDDAGAKQYYYVDTGGSYQSSSDKRVLIGLGNSRLKLIRIAWPSGIEQTLTVTDIKRYYRIEEGKW